MFIGRCTNQTKRRKLNDMLLAEEQFSFFERSVNRNGDSLRKLMNFVTEKHIPWFKHHQSTLSMFCCLEVLRQFNMKIAG